jgi:DNA-binding XRE family transcriptional regulator
MMSFSKRYVEHRSTFDSKFKEEWEKSQLQRELSSKLVELRLQLGLNQSQFAKMIGVKQSFLSRLENGEQNITIQTLQEIANHAGAIVKIDLSLKEPVSN